MKVKVRKFNTGQMLGFGNKKVIFDNGCGPYFAMVHFLGESESFLTYRSNLYEIEEARNAK